MKMVFWNVAGIKKKDKEFWEYIETFDIVGLTETWIEQNEWERVKGKLQSGFRWEIQGAIKEKNKGRASGGDP